MKIPLFSRSMVMPFDGLQHHAEKVKECGWTFQQAMECYASRACDKFEQYRQEVDRLESEADGIKREIRASISKKARLPVPRFPLFMYIREQDKVLDCVEESLNWISFRPEPALMDELKDNFFEFVNAVIVCIEELYVMVAEARKYFDNYSEHQRNIVKGIINNLRKSEHDADGLEYALKLRIFSIVSDPTTNYHLIKLTDHIGAIADHAENAGDMMGAMIAR